MGKQNDEKQNLTEEIYMSGHGLDWEDSMDLAEQIFNAGYRKQSDTAQEIFAEIGKILTAKYNAMQLGFHHRMRFGVVDSPAGMKEFGMVSGVKEIINEIKAFEEKYMKGE